MYTLHHLFIIRFWQFFWQYFFQIYHLTACACIAYEKKVPIAISRDQLIVTSPHCCTFIKIVLIVLILKYYNEYHALIIYYKCVINCSNLTQSYVLLDNILFSAW